LCVIIFPLVTDYSRLPGNESPDKLTSNPGTLRILNEFSWVRNVFAASLTALAAGSPARSRAGQQGAEHEIVGATAGHGLIAAGSGPVGGALLPAEERNGWLTGWTRTRSVIISSFIM
jgi:hypothetical protein